MATTNRTLQSASTSSARRTTKVREDVVVSIRLSRDVLSQIDELAEDQERSRASVLARALREYAEQEYSRLLDLREAEQELEQGKGIPHEQLGKWLDHLKAGKGRPEQLK